VVLIAVLVGTDLPITPVQILWINMSTAIFLGLMLAFEPGEPGIMQRHRGIHPSADPSDGARHPLLQEVAGRLEPFGLKSRLLLSGGDPRSALDRVAEQNAADLLVVASRGRGALPKMVVGSVAAYLLRHADRAVAVVPHGTQ